VKVALSGASGRLGRPLAHLLEEAGHEVRRLHRDSETYPVDLRTGAGLARALSGVEIVIHAAHATGPRQAAAVLLGGSRRLLRGAPDAHHVLISLAGAETIAVHSRYARVKVAQARLVREADPGASILASTPFHELVGRVTRRAARVGLELCAPIPLAPVSAAEAAATVLTRLLGVPGSAATLTLSGPETLTLGQLRVRRGLPLPIPRAGGLLRALGDGALIPPDPDVRGVLTYPQWLTEQLGRPWRPAPSAARGS
jgi:uncharacterized protein YbjT (DUF2867 family)